MQPSMAEDSQSPAVIFNATQSHACHYYATIMCGIVVCLPASSPYT